MSVLKPTSAPKLTFWFSGGSIIWRGDGKCVPIEARQAEALRDLYGDEADAAVVARDVAAELLAHNLFLELSRALGELATWKRLFVADVRAA